MGHMRESGQKQQFLPNLEQFIIAHPSQTKYTHIKGRPGHIDANFKLQVYNSE